MIAEEEKPVAAREEEGFATALGDIRAAAGVQSGLLRWGPVLALAAVAGVLLALRLDRPAFYDNEGRYAEVAREMIASGDWLTPRLDFILFLNKPPLVYWLTAAVFHVLGPSEWARLVSVVAAVLTVVAASRLGERLYGHAIGLLGGLLLATSVGFALEARTLRPDAIVIASVTGAIFCWLRAGPTPSARSWRWLCAMYAMLGIGVLAKGLVPVVATAVPIVLVTLHGRGWRGLAELRPGLGVAVLAAVVLPWHVVAALRHPGFAWDYVVNQHLLFFLDRKLPRDSEGDSLAFFWTAFLARSLPWIVLVPLTAREAAAGISRRADADARATLLLWIWAAGVLLLFSCAPSRLEHYSLPAAPAVALLAARGWALLQAGRVGRAGWRWLAAAAASCALIGVVGVESAPTLLGRVEWLSDAPGMVDLARAAGFVLLVGGLVIGFAVVCHSPRGLLVAATATAVPMIVLVLVAEVAAEPVFSWRPVARALSDGAPPEAEIVFEAPVEYQLVGGLAYYTARRITLLEVPGFVPPTYLAAERDAMFLSRAAFRRRWDGGEPLVLVSDPQRHRTAAAEIVPGPSHVIARFGDRWVLDNFAVSR